MVQDILNEIKEKINQADLVLIGVGEQVAVPTRKMDSEQKYNDYMKIYDDETIYPYLQQVFIKENCQEYVEFYNRLYELIKDKNYYILTTNVDDVIFSSKLDKERIVAPCGSIHQFVCEDCKGDIELFDSQKVEENLHILNSNMDKKIKRLKCSKCGKPLSPNIVSYEYYDEKGYLDKWNRYTKWLQGTVNRNLCILELGVGLNYPTVIRWPNERIITYNNKAFMYRVHDKLFQLSEGIGERAKSVPENPMFII